MAPPQLVGFQCFYGFYHVEMNERRIECMIYMLYELKYKVRDHLVIEKSQIVNSKYFCDKSQRKTKMRHSTWTPGQIKQKRDLSCLPGRERFLRLFATVRLWNWRDVWWEPLRNALIHGWEYRVYCLDAWLNRWLGMSCKIHEGMTGNILWIDWMHDKNNLETDWMHHWKCLVQCLNAWQGISCELT